METKDDDSQKISVNVKKGDSVFVLPEGAKVAAMATIVKLESEDNPEKLTIRWCVAGYKAEVTRDQIQPVIGRRKRKLTNAYKPPPPVLDKIKKNIKKENNGKAKDPNKHSKKQKMPVFGNAKNRSEKERKQRNQSRTLFPCGSGKQNREGKQVLLQNDLPIPNVVTSRMNKKSVDDSLRTKEKGIEIITISSDDDEGGDSSMFSDLKEGGTSENDKDNSDESHDDMPSHLFRKKDGDSVASGFFSAIEEDQSEKSNHDSIASGFFTDPEDEAKSKKSDHNSIASGFFTDPEDEAKSKKSDHDSVASGFFTDPEDEAKSKKSDHDSVASGFFTDPEDEAKSKKSDHNSIASGFFTDPEDEDEDANADQDVDHRHSETRIVYPKVIPEIKNKQKPKAATIHYGGDDTIEIMEVTKHPHKFFLRFLFKDRLLIYKCNPGDYLEKEMDMNGNTYVLAATKYEDPNHSRKSFMYNGSKIGGRAMVKACYIAMPSDEPDRCMQQELNSIADFESLPCYKAASRLELLLSPALETKRMLYQWTLSCDNFEIVPDNHNLGCGFIPQTLLQELLGVGYVKSQRSFAVQVRIVASSLGIFKGMLMIKPGISKIQLPESMQKVGKSKEKDSEKDSDSFKDAYIEFVQIFPSSSSITMDRFLNPNEKNPSKSEKKELASRGLGVMIKSLMLASGVDPEVLKSYENDCENFTRRGHSYVVGVADPTNEIPEGYIFVSGLGVGPSWRTKLWITRSPCTEVDNARLLPRVSVRPRSMSKSNWQFLTSLHFGVVIFGAPKNDAKPLPPTIAEGDLDGDLYLVCFDEEILQSIQKRGPSTTDENKFIVHKDNLVGQKVTKTFDDGLMCSGKVIRFMGEEYLVDFGGGRGEQYLTKDEVVNGRFFVDRILSHRRTRKNVEVEVEWKTPDGSNTSKTWQIVDKQFKEEASGALADYAINHDLLSEPSWKWARRHVSDAIPLKIIGHKKEGGKLKVEVFWDDLTKSWELFSDQKKDTPDLLVDYAEQNELLNNKHWLSLKEHIRRKKDVWFDTLQELLSDTQRLADFSALTKSLGGAHKKALIESKDDDAHHLGRAWRKSLDICKHGGKVDLPYHLLKYIRNRKLHNLITLK